MIFKSYDFFLNEARGYSNDVNDIEPDLKRMLDEMLISASKEAMAGHMRGKESRVLTYRSKKFPIGKCTVYLRWVLREEEPTVRTAAFYNNDMEIINGKAEFSVDFRVRIPLSFYLISKSAERFKQKLAADLNTRYFFDSFIAHEFTHALEDYNRKKKGELGIAGSSGYAKNVASQKLLSKGSSHQALMDLFYYMYTSDPVEIRAMVAGTAALIKTAKRGEAVQIIKDSEAYRISGMMEKFSIRDFKSIPIGELQKEIIEIVDTLHSSTNYAAEIAMNIAKQSNVDPEKLKQYLTTLKAPSMKDTPEEFLEPLIKEINAAGKNLKRKLLKLVSS